MQCTSQPEAADFISLETGTLVHYPTVADPLEAVWQDDHGSISGRSARKGVNVYTDQAGACLCADPLAMNSQFATSIGRQLFRTRS